jgi:hypothetical protein
MKYFDQTCLLNAHLTFFFYMLTNDLIHGVLPYPSPLTHLALII